MYIGIMDGPAPATIKKNLPGIASCFACFGVPRENEQLRQAFKEFEDIQAGFGNSSAQADVKAPDIATKAAVDAVAHVTAPAGTPTAASPAGFSTLHAPPPEKPAQPDSEAKQGTQHAAEIVESKSEPQLPSAADGEPANGGVADHRDAAAAPGTPQQKPAQPATGDVSDRNAPRPVEVIAAAESTAATAAVSVTPESPLDSRTASAPDCSCDGDSAATATTTSGGGDRNGSDHDDGGAKGVVSSGVVAAGGSNGSSSGSSEVPAASADSDPCTTASASASSSAAAGGSSVAISTSTAATAASTAGPAATPTSAQAAGRPPLSGRPRSAMPASSSPMRQLSGISPRYGAGPGHAAAQSAVKTPVGGGAGVRSPGRERTPLTSGAAGSPSKQPAACVVPSRYMAWYEQRQQAMAAVAAASPQRAAAGAVSGGKRPASASPGVRSFGVGSSSGSGLYHGGGSGKYGVLYGAASMGLAASRGTPPPPGVFTSASTRLALHDVLHHHRGSRGLAGSVVAASGRAGFSVSGLSNIDFRPQWRY